MNELCIYIALYCGLLYTQSALQSCGGISPQPPPVWSRGWTTSDFLKSTFMWWKSSRSWLVADDVINEQISLEMWLTPCAQLWTRAAHMTNASITAYFYQFFSLWVIIFLTDSCAWCIVRATVLQQRIWLEHDNLYNKLFKMCNLPFNFEHPVI